jgi:hypothetical protein
VLAAEVVVDVVPDVVVGIEVGFAVVVGDVSRVSALLYL